VDQFLQVGVHEVFDHVANALQAYEEDPVTLAACLTCAKRMEVHVFLAHHKKFICIYRMDLRVWVAFGGFRVCKCLRATGIGA
jgi:hypothetical protein